jgi:hypothetical protein
MSEQVTLKCNLCPPENAKTFTGVPETDDCPYDQIADHILTDHQRVFDVVTIEATGEKD